MLEMDERNQERQIDFHLPSTMPLSKANRLMVKVEVSINFFVETGVTSTFTKAKFL